MSSDVILAYATKILWVIAVFVVGLYGSKMLSSMVRRGMERARIDITLTRFTTNLVRWAIIALVVIACLGAFGIETTSFAALIGAAGLAIGLAFQGTLSSVASGVMLLVLRPFKVGDVVTLAGQTGIVEEIGLFTTRMYAFANHVLILPNKQVFDAPIENKTFEDKARVDVDVGTDVGANLDTVRGVLLDAISALPGGERPQVYLNGFGTSSIQWSVRMWTEPTNYLGLRDAMTVAIKKALVNAEITIPFPQMGLHLAAVDGKTVISTAA